MALLLSVALGIAGAAATAAPAPPLEVRGLPFTRFYSFDDIGDASAGARLAFDPIGRLAVIYQGDCFVLNDATWLNITSGEAVRVQMQQIVGDRDGHFYYGASGSWGTIAFDPDERLHLAPLVPASAPDWTKATAFTQIVTTHTGAYFAQWNGVVYWDRATGKNLFFPADGVTRLFTLGNRVYVFSHSEHVQFIDVAAHALRRVDDGPLGSAYIDQTTRWNRTNALVSTSDQRLLAFDGRHFTPWKSELGPRLQGRVSCLERLAGGGLAIAISGEGLYLMSEKGDIFCSLTDSEHQRITDLASREPGVLWIVTENGVEKVLYRSPVTVFGQRLGLPISWPQVVRWKDRVVVASAGRLYETSPSAPGATARFHLVAGQPSALIWAIAANGPRMLVGNQDGVFVRVGEDHFSRVMSGIDAARLVMIGSDFCYVIGGTEIGALRWSGGRWSECAPRVPSAGYPAIAHAAGQSAWLELLNGNSVERVAYRDGRIRTRTFSPWPKPGWINVGVVGTTVVLTPADGRRRFFDEKTARFVEAPALSRLLSQAPFRILRLQQGADRTIWATYARGALTIRPGPNGYRIDAARFSMLSDRNLNIQLLPDGDVWFSGDMSLYHVEKPSGPETRPPIRPVLVSITHGRTSEGIFALRRSAIPRFRFPYSDNSLRLRFFAGSYAFRRTPGYEFRLSPTPGGWTSLGTDSLLTFPNLQEGIYRLEVRLADSQGPVGKVLALGFRIDPPWFRTWYAYALYLMAATLLTLALFRLYSRSTNARNAELETLVQERTSQLKAAIEELNAEARNAATLAERDRLAGEIHDSIQQGLSGVMLQLEATLKLANLAADIRSRLRVARDMVSFTRREVQHAVWDMESPVLEGTGLGEALRKISALISGGAPKVEVAVIGPEMRLSSSTQHHLLRVAQEAISNAVRHAAPREISVLLEHGPGAVSLTVADDGRGFVPEEVLCRGVGHFGLRGLRSRSAKLGAELHINSAPGKGTRIMIIVPSVVPSGAPAEFESHAAAR
ncbi:MAG: ATP-binding protein [Opitutaceae bacterium]